MAVTNHIDNAIETIESHPLNPEYFNGKKWSGYVITYDPTSSGDSAQVGLCVNQTIRSSANGGTSNITYAAQSSDTLFTRPYIYTTSGSLI